MIKSLYSEYQHWSDGGCVWLYSDTHFEDDDCVLMCPDWPHPMKQVNLLNKYIGKNDTFILLGDVGNPEYINKIKCKRKFLVCGNHDKGRSYYLDYFDDVWTGPKFISEKICISHEPFVMPFGVNIHGHEHNADYQEKIVGNCKLVNLAADVRRFIPYNLGEAIKNGLLSDTPTIHRLAIDKQKENSIHAKL